MVGHMGAYEHVVFQITCNGSTDVMLRNFGAVQLPRDVCECMLDYLLQRPRVSRLSWPEFLVLFGLQYGDFRHFVYINEGIPGQRHL